MMSDTPQSGRSDLESRRPGPDPVPPDGLLARNRITLTIDPHAEPAAVEVDLIVATHREWARRCERGDPRWRVAGSAAAVVVAYMVTG
jgi:hypothetical protein